MEGITILVVDDDHEIVDAIGKLLETQGYQVQKAFHGLDAVHILEEEEIHLIIMDIMMPKQDGLIQTEKLRTEVAAIALMVLGGTAIYNRCNQEDTFLQEVVFAVCVGGILSVIFLYFKGSISIAKRYVDMQNKIQNISQNHFQSQKGEPGLTPFAKELEQLDRIGMNFEENLEKKIKAERTKVELVTNQSRGSIAASFPTRLGLTVQPLS